MPLSTLRENAIVAFDGLIDAIPTTTTTTTSRGGAIMRRRRFLAEEDGGILSQRNLNEFERGTSTAELN